MTTNPLRVASIGIGWWSDVLAEAAGRTNGKVEIAACYTRSEDKRLAFARKFGCRAASSLQEVLADDGIDAIINTTPNHVHLETTRAAAAAGKHVFLDKPIANRIDEAKEITRVCKMIHDAGGDQAHGNMQPYLGINYIIALVGIYPSRG